MKTYYLYLKTHNQTGLKYLGFTGLKDPCKYTGSGKYWLKHINKHGYDVKTEILFESNSLEEIKSTGIYFSELWDIVNNNEFANLKVECGHGGAQSLESIKRGLETKKQNGTLNTNTPERIKKGLETKKQNGTLGKNNITPESIAKQLETKKQNGTLNTNTPESIIKRKETMLKNGTTTSTSESSLRGVETKRKNGTLKRDESTKNKIRESRAANGSNVRSQESIEKQKQTLKNKPKQLCPHCNRMIGGIGNYNRYHDENCKLKII